MLRLVILLAAFVAFNSCSQKREKNNETRELGKYVYIDHQGVMHSEKDCTALLFLENKGVEFVEKKDIKPEQLKSLCSDCIDDELYEQLLSITNKN